MTDDTTLTPERKETLRSRFTAGVAFLDKKRPTWAHDIPLPEKLDVRKGDRCVTAQLSGCYSWVIGKDQLGLNQDQYEQHGFAVPDSDFETIEGERAGYAFLTALWKEEVFRRLAQATEEN